MNTLYLVLSHNYVITINQYLNQCLHLVLYACILSDEKARKTFYKKVALCSHGGELRDNFHFLAIIKFLSPRKLSTLSIGIFRFNRPQLKGVTGSCNVQLCRILLSVFGTFRLFLACITIKPNQFYGRDC